MKTVVKAKVLKVDPLSPDESVIDFAATLLKGGGLVAFPTETVYGIGVDSLNEKSVKRLYEIKNRPLNKPFTLHISSIDMITNMQCEISDFAKKLINKFWPGPLTIILKADNKKLGFRMPKNNIAKDIISKVGSPLFVPSANLSGEKPPTEVTSILEKLGDKLDLILDSGKTELEKESTVVDLTVPPYKILRKGAIEENEIASVWSEAV